MEAMAAVGPTRRDFVALLLGAAAGAACGGARARRIPPGVLVETGARRGHALVRDAAGRGRGRRARAAPTRWREHQVAIVGAGIAGLAAAWELRRRGITDVVIFELDDVAGGTARGGASDVTRYPWGAHCIVAPQRDQAEPDRAARGAARDRALPARRHAGRVGGAALPRARGAHLLSRPLVRGALPRGGRGRRGSPAARGVQARDRAVGDGSATRRGGGRSRCRSRARASCRAARARRHLVRRVARRARLHVGAAALALRLLVPRRLRAPGGRHQRVGRAVLLRVAPQRLRLLVPVRADVARRQRGARCATWRRPRGSRPASR